MKYKDLSIHQKINIKSYIIIAEVFVSEHYNRYTEVAKLNISDLDDMSCRPSKYRPYKSLETIKTRIFRKRGKIYHYGIHRRLS